MESMRQILAQMTLNLELNIAMCDKLASHDDEFAKIKPRLEALNTKVEALSKRVSELQYTLANKAYEERTGGFRAK